MEQGNGNESEKQPSKGFVIYVIIAVIFACILIYVFGGCSDDSSGTNTSSRNISNPRIVYEITGTNVSGVSLTYENDSGGTNQGDYEVPFKKTFTKFEAYDFVYISAQIILPTSGAGAITCKIYQDGDVIAEGRSKRFSEHCYM